VRQPPNKGELYLHIVQRGDGNAKPGSSPGVVARHESAVVGLCDPICRRILWFGAVAQRTSASAYTAFNSFGGLTSMSATEFVKTRSQIERAVLYAPQPELTACFPTLTGRQLASRALSSAASGVRLSEAHRPCLASYLERAAGILPAGPCTFPHSAKRSGRCGSRPSNYFWFTAETLRRRELVGRTVQLAPGLVIQTKLLGLNIFPRSYERGYELVLKARAPPGAQFHNCQMLDNLEGRVPPRPTTGSYGPV